MALRHGVHALSSCAAALTWRQYEALALFAFRHYLIRHSARPTDAADAS
jgi:hypothetical protein